jgi:hypothetical protein
MLLIFEVDENNFSPVFVADFNGRADCDIPPYLHAKD